MIATTGGFDSRDNTLTHTLSQVGDSNVSSARTIAT
jgi:hypothetical protein